MKADNYHLFSKIPFFEHFANISLKNFMIDISEHVTHPIKNYS